jgi:hypothetical protein
MGLQAWLASDDTGQSSLYMASVLGGFRRDYAHPRDLDDFGRCSRLLDAVPEFRPRLSEMRDKSPEWAALVDSWEAIEKIIPAEKYQEADRLVAKCVDSKRYA